MAKKEKETENILVLSNKGGCGKTTVALLHFYYDFYPDYDLTLNLKDFELSEGSLGTQSEKQYLGKKLAEIETSKYKDYVRIKEFSENERNNFIFDMDILGTVLGRHIEPKKYFTEYVESNINLLKCKRSIPMSLEAEDSGGLFIFSPHESSKEKFRIKDKQLPHVSFDMFYAKVVKLIKDANNLTGGKKVQYVFDLPPSADGYAHILVDSLTKTKGDSLAAQHKYRLELVVPFDIEVEKNILDWLIHFLNYSASRNPPESINIIVNDAYNRKADPNVKEALTDFIKLIVDEMKYLHNYKKTEFFLTYIDHISDMSLISIRALVCGLPKHCIKSISDSVRKYKLEF